MNSTDGTIISGLAAANNGAGTAITESTYNADADINRDGQVNEDDDTFFAAIPARAPLGGTGSGRISDPDGTDNVLGYCGYVFNREHRNYTVRYRIYFPELGRWGQREPREYEFGMMLYEYCLSNSYGLVDPDGQGPISWILKKTAKYLTKKALKQTLKKFIDRIKKRAPKCDEAKQFIEDAEELLEILEQEDSLLMEAAGLVPVAGDILDAVELTKTGIKLWKKFKELDDKYDIYIEKIRKRGVNRAWAKEQERARRGEPLTRKWTPEEIELLKKGKKPIDPLTGKAYAGHHKKCVEECPEFADDPDNIEFLDKHEHLEKHGKEPSVGL